MSAELNATEVAAVRATVVRAWLGRDVLKLSAAEVDQALMALIAISEPREAEAAATLLQARREATHHQQTFDQLLEGNDGRHPDFP